MSHINFHDDPDLWPEEWTDCFQIDLNANTKDVGKSLLDAAKQSNVANNQDFVVFPQHHILFTSHQYFVDCIKDELYGAEIAFSHTHIPRVHE
ncbi:MAG: hypothetical protein AAFY91_06685 [Bacteroidota bacterium]